MVYYLITKNGIYQYSNILEIHTTYVLTLITQLSCLWYTNYTRMNDLYVLKYMLQYQTLLLAIIKTMNGDNAKRDLVLSIVPLSEWGHI